VGGHRVAEAGQAGLARRHVQRPRDRHDPLLPRATSLNGTDWTSAHTTTTGDGGFDEIALDTSARYVRLNLTQRGTAYGYSLWEFGVYG
jgi:hypothetical protein